MRPKVFICRTIVLATLISCALLGLITVQPVQAEATDAEKRCQAFLGAHVDIKFIEDNGGIEKLCQEFLQSSISDLVNPLSDHHITFRFGVTPSVIGNNLNELVDNAYLITCWGEVDTNMVGLKIWNNSTKLCTSFEPELDEAIEYNLYFSETSCRTVRTQPIGDTITQSLDLSNQTTPYAKCKREILEMSARYFGTDDQSQVDMGGGDSLDCVNEPASNGHLTLRDFEEMQMFAKYIATALSSCTQKNQVHCNKITEKDKQNLSVIIGLTAMGSLGKTISDYELSLMPEKHLLDNKLNNTSCELFSDLTSLITSSTTDTCAFDNNNKPGCGVSRLITLCKSNSCQAINTCLKVTGQTDSHGLLSPYKTQPIFLQTLYWNGIDNKRINFGWNKLTDADKARMNEVIEYSSGNQIRECKNENQSIINSPNTNENSQSDAKKKFSCDVDGGLGWLLCGGADFMMSSYDWAYKQLDGYLTLKTKVLDPTKIVNDKNEPITSINHVENIWKTMVTAANVLVVIAILIIVLSQVTGYGLSNYSIKKMLPKIIVAVILANISYTIIKLLADVSNLAGQGVYNFFVEATKVSSFTGPTDLASQFYQSATATVLNIIVFIIGALLWMLTMVVQIFILSMRDAILIVVAVTAPIVAILYFLPNTKKITSYWLRGLSFVIMLYPMVATVYAAGRVGYQLSVTSDTDFISGLVSRTILILPMMFTPYLAIKLGKGIPAMAVGINALTKKVRGLASGTDKPKAGSRRDFIQKRLADIDDQVKAGQYKGWRPIRRLKSKIFGMVGDSAIFAEGTVSAREKLAKNRASLAETTTLDDANSIINYFDMARPQPGGNRAEMEDDSVPPLSSSAAVQALRGRAGTTKDMVLTAALTHIQQNQKLGNAADTKTFFLALNVAKRYGASQEELQTTYRQALSYYKGHNDFASVGDLKGVAKYFDDHRNDYGGETWGQYDENLFDYTINEDGSDTDFTTYRKKAIRSEMIHQVLEQPTDKDGHKKTLEANYMPEDSIAREVFTNEFNNNLEFEAAIREQAPSFSANTYESINTSLNGGLIYNAFTANLTQQDFDDLVSYTQGTLSDDREAELRGRLSRIKGHGNASATALRPDDLDLEAIHQTISQLPGALPTDAYSRLIGRSFKNVTIDLPLKPINTPSATLDTPPTINQVTPPSQTSDNSTTISIAEIQAKRQAQRQQYSRYIGGVVNRNSRYGRNTQSNPKQKNKP